MCKLTDFKHLVLLPGHRVILESELDLWHQHYPVSDTVLDLGAGCGETAQYYLNHGAKRVICIEANPEALECLHTNFDRDTRVEIIGAFVSTVKIDIEGSEKGTIIETHFPTKFEKVKRIAPRVYIYRLRENWGNPFRKALRKLSDFMIRFE